MVSFLGFGSSSDAAAPVSELPSRSTSSSPDSAAAVSKEVNPLNPKGLKPCCACPETKSARDECFLRTAPGEQDIKCGELLEAHKACMRGYGFKV